MWYLKKSFVGIVVAVMLSGCIFSLHPLYTEKDVIYSSDLVGQWTAGEGKAKWEFRTYMDDTYELVRTAKDGTEGRFWAVLLKVRGHMFLDLEPLNPREDLNLMPVHTFYHVKQITPVLQIRTLVSNLEEHSDVNLKDIRHEKQDKNVLLTAQPKELQEFLIKHLNTKDAFTNFRNMKRISAEDDTETEEKVLNTDAHDAHASGDSQLDSAVPE